MPFEAGLVDWIGEAMTPVGAVTFRRMMGGATLYCDGVIFAIVLAGELWLKADAESGPEWDAAGLTERFTVAFKDGRVDQMNYRRAPEDCYDDPEALRRWAALALAAGARGPRKRRKR